MQLALKTALAIGSLILLLGCDDPEDNPSGTYDGPKNSCKSNCPKGSVCDTELDFCVVQPIADAKTYFLNVMPDTGTDEHVFLVTLGEDGRAMEPLRVFETPDIVFQIFSIADDKKEQNLKTKVIFTDMGLSIPGRSPKTATYTFPGLKETFRIKLSPGENRYRIKVIPLGDKANDFPARYYDDVTVTESGGLLNADGEYFDELVVPKAQQFIKGILRSGNQLLDGLTVEALDPDTGHILSTRSISTGCSGSDSETTCGSFQIGLAPGVTSFSLHIYKANEPWYPSVTLPGFRIEPEESDLALINRGSIDLEPLARPITYHARVEGKDRPTEGMNNCFVIFKSSLIAGGSVVRNAFTNGSGALEAESGTTGVALFPGLYQVTIIPPKPFSPLMMDYNVLFLDNPIDISGTSEIKGQVFSLEQRPRLQGRVANRNEQGLSSILRTEPLDSTLSHNRSSTTAVGSDGSFDIWVDRGDYRLTAEAHPNSGYAWGVRRVDVSKDSYLSIQPGIPFVARAELVSEKVALNDIAVEWYEAVGETAFLVGRSISDASGRVTALLPP